MTGVEVVIYGGMIREQDAETVEDLLRRLHHKEIAPLWV